LDEHVQVEKELEKEKEEMVSQKTEAKPEERMADISPARIERMKKAFRPTWIQDQINSPGKIPGNKKS
jgi:hypothetical protein